jgi:hypothetical protein
MRSAKPCIATLAHLILATLLFFEQVFSPVLGATNTSASNADLGNAVPKEEGKNNPSKC